MADRARARSEYELSVGTPAESVTLARLRAADLAVAMRERVLRFDGARHLRRPIAQQAPLPG